jgi:hypothetical protein
VEGRAVNVMYANAKKGKLLIDAFCTALSASLFGLYLVRTTQHFDRLSLIATVLFGACLIAALLYTRRKGRRLAESEIAKKAPIQFLWSCIFFSMISFGLGMAVSGWIWFGTDFMRGFNLLFWSAMTGIAIYPVSRDAKRLAHAADLRTVN